MRMSTCYTVVEFSDSDAWEMLDDYEEYLSCIEEPFDGNASEGIEEHGTVYRMR